ncbi:hypothetical protein MKX68_03070 [Paenibacillus sp. FSL M8-0212]|uniref:hypothetical protein n=1 Tax=Paenibacillus sp. FSL M8-0212 TaxID=2921618 RepID=UPI0030F70A7D
MRLKINISIIMNVLLTLCLIALTVFSIHQYKLQTSYKDYLSQNLSYDIITLAQAIESNNKLYEQLLQTDTSTSDIRIGLNVLYNNYRSIASIAGTYSSMYNQFQDFNESASLDIENLSSSTIKMRDFLQDVMEKNSLIDSKIKTVLEKEYASNSKWLQVIEQSELFSVKENGEISFNKDENLSINDSTWVNFFKELEANTSNS